MYSIICEDTLLPTEHADAAEYPPVDKYTLGRDSTVEDICDFIIEYIDSDVLVGVDFMPFGYTFLKFVP